MWPHTREPARHARQWEEVVNFMLESDVVRFVLYDSARWKQWGNRSRRQATEEQKIIILPVGDGCRPAGALRRIISKAERPHLGEEEAAVFR